MNTESDTLTEVRADVWLWAARFFKTRSLAKQALAGGKVRQSKLYYLRGLEGKKARIKEDLAARSAD